MNLSIDRMLLVESPIVFIIMNQIILRKDFQLNLIPITLNVTM